MKKTLLIIASALFAVGSLVSCKESGPEEMPAPIVSIKADQQFNSEFKANLTLSLSAASTEDVVVRLGKSDPQSGKKFITSHYEKNVTIKAGQTHATIEVEADVFGIDDGDYQTAIAIVSAEGAELCEKPVAYIDLTFIYQPAVELYADEAVGSDKTAKLKIILEKASSKEVEVNLKDGEGCTFHFKYDKKVVVPAGEKEKEIVLTADIPADMESGKYESVIEIESVANAIKGSSTSVKVALVWPMSATITIDGKFEDWQKTAIATYALGDGKYLYNMVKEMKIAANSKFVYLYFKFDDPSKNGSKGDFIASTLPTDIYVDADGNPATGSFITAIDNDTAYPPYKQDKMGLEYYIELALHGVDQEGGLGGFNDFYSWGGVYQYTGKDNENLWSGLKNLGGTYDAAAICGNGKFEEGIGEVEVQFSRKWFGMKNNKVRFAVKIMDAFDNWKTLGILPQEKISGAERPLGNMAEAMLPPYEE